MESLGLEIQTIQSAMAGIHRINDFFEMDEIVEIEESAPSSEENIAGEMVENESRTWMEIRRFKP